jgi:hypothetical protein
MSAREISAPARQAAYPGLPEIPPPLMPPGIVLRRAIAKQRGLPPPFPREPEPRDDIRWLVWYWRGIAENRARSLAARARP